jgi:hypothetical protein
VLQCGKLQKLSLNERRRALEASRLCMFCLRHPANTECFDQGGCTKPACVQPGCKGRHAFGVHELLGGEDASVNLVTEEGRGMEENKDLYVNIARFEQEEDDWQEPDTSWLELDGGESEEEAGAYCVSAGLRKDDSGLEDELEYFHDVTPPLEEEGVVEDRCWSPEQKSEEEDKEENQYLVSLLMGGLETGGNDPETTQPQTEAATAPAGGDLQALEGEPVEEKSGPQENTPSSELPARKRPRRRMPRKKEVCNEQESWEAVRRDAWLRELLTDSSEDEPEGECTRFEESGRWIAEITGSRDRGNCEPTSGEIDKKCECER